MQTSTSSTGRLRPGGSVRSGSLESRGTCRMTLQLRAIAQEKGGATSWGWVGGLGYGSVKDVGLLGCKVHCIT